MPLPEERDRYENDRILIANVFRNSDVPPEVLAIFEGSVALTLKEICAVTGGSLATLRSKLNYQVGGLLLSRTRPGSHEFEYTLSSVFHRYDNFRSALVASATSRLEVLGHYLLTVDATSAHGFIDQQGLRFIALCGASIIRSRKADITKQCSDCERGAALIESTSLESNLRVGLPYRPGPPWNDPWERTNTGPRQRGERLWLIESFAQPLLEDPTFAPGLNVRDTFRIPANDAEFEQILFNIIRPSIEILAKALEQHGATPVSRDLRLLLLNSVDISECVGDICRVLIAFKAGTTTGRALIRHATDAYQHLLRDAIMPRVHDDDQPMNSCRRIGENVKKALESAPADERPWMTNDLRSFLRQHSTGSAGVAVAAAIIPRVTHLKSLRMSSTL